MKRRGSVLSGGRRGAALLVGTDDSAGHVNVTPMIDVVMCLIVFFLLVGHLAVEKRGGVALPDAVAGDRGNPRDTPVIIALPRPGTLLIDGVATPPDRVAEKVAALQQREPWRNVQIRAARDLPMGDVRAALAAVRDAGVGTVEVAAIDRTD